MDDEALLIDQAKAGSMESFTRLVGIHQARIRAYLSRQVRDRDVADDLAQETFFSAFRSLPSYDPAQAPLAVWLVGIARNWALSHFRGRTRQQTLKEGALQAALSGWKLQRLESPGGAPDQEDGRISALEKCVGSLPAHSADIVQNFYYRGVRIAKLAQDLGQREDRIRKALQRIRQALRNCVRQRLAVEGK